MSQNIPSRSSIQQQPLKLVYKPLHKTQLAQPKRNSLLINSSFQQNPPHEDTLDQSVTHDVLKKVSQVIISVHSSLLPKTENIEIYRDLSYEEESLLKAVQPNNQLHTILAGVLAIDSCFKCINREEGYVVNSVMKGLVVCLDGLQGLEEWIKVGEGEMSVNGEGENGIVRDYESFVRFYDALKLVVQEIQKIPSARLKVKEIKLQNQLLNCETIAEELTQLIQQQKVALLSSLNERLTDQKQKISLLEERIQQLNRQNEELLIKSTSTIPLSNTVPPLNLTPGHKSPTKPAPTKRQNINKNYIGHQKNSTYNHRQQQSIHSSLSSSQNRPQYVNGDHIREKPPSSSENQNNTITDSVATTKEYLQEVIQLKDELYEKNEIILKMNEQFAEEMKKYESVFKRLEGENKLLKKYNDLDMALILEDLEFEVERLREQRRNDRRVIGQIMGKIDGMMMGEQLEYGHEQLLQHHRSAKNLRPQEMTRHSYGPRQRDNSSILEKRSYFRGAGDESYEDADMEHQRHRQQQRSLSTRGHEMEGGYLPKYSTSRDPGNYYSKAGQYDEVHARRSSSRNPSPSRMAQDHIYSKNDIGNYFSSSTSRSPKQYESQFNREQGFNKYNRERKVSQNDRSSSPKFGNAQQKYEQIKAKVLRDRSREVSGYGNGEDFVELSQQKERKRSVTKRDDMKKLPGKHSIIKGMGNNFVGIDHREEITGARKMRRSGIAAKEQPNNIKGMRGYFY